MYGDGMYEPGGGGPIPGIIGYRESKNTGSDSKTFDVPDRGSIEGKHKHNRETAPAELNPPHTMEVALVEGQGGRDVANVAVWQGVGLEDYECNVCHCKATSSLDPRVNTVDDRNSIK